MDEVLERIAVWAKRLAGAEPVSVSWNCNTAHYLEAGGHRRAAYPFDWVFCSPEIVTDAVARRFDDFIDPGRLIPVDGTLAAGHARYHVRMFNHGSPLSSPDVRTAYARRIARFLALFDGAAPICFVATALPEPDGRPAWRDGFSNDFARPAADQRDARALYAGYARLLTLSGQRAGSTFLVVIRQWTGRPHRGLTLELEARDGLVLDIAATGLNDGIRFIDEADDALCRRVYSALLGGSPHGGNGSVAPAPAERT